jgi:hypothetical protein
MRILRMDASDDQVEIPDFISFLPERVWYLTESGKDMWCRRPYAFFFSSSEAAIRFAGEMKSEFTLEAIGIASKELVSDSAIEALRQLQVTRIFVDPQIDPQTSDVFGTILRLTPTIQ